MMSRTEALLFVGDDFCFTARRYGHFKFQFPVGSRPGNRNVAVRRGDDSFGPIEAAGFGANDEAFEAGLQGFDSEDA